MNREEAEHLVSTREYWHHTFEVFPGVTTKGNYNPEFMWNLLDLPSDLRGRRAIDIGPSDGYFSMRMAQAGAEVVSVDYRAKDSHGFGLMERITGLSFDYRQANIYDLPSLNLGKFDIVLMLGLLYHLPDMLKALKIARDLCRSRILIETEYEPDLTPGIAAARYYEAQTLNNDFTNFWAPNRECLLGMLTDVGFTPDRHRDWGRRLLVEAHAGGAESTEKMRAAYGIL